MSHLHPDLIALADAVEILSPSRYLVLGRERDVPRSPDGRDPADARVDQLAGDLYERVFVRPSEPDGPAGESWLGNRDFLTSLSSGNRGKGPWESGWTVRRHDGEAIVVAGRQPLDLWAHPDGVRPVAGALEPGAPCRVRLPRELRFLAGGYYFALGDQVDDGTGPSAEPAQEETSTHQLRYYWHLTSGAAASFVTAATSILNSAEVPFRLKVVRYPAAYSRADAGVLYIGLRHARGLERLIGRIYEEVRSGLRPAVPLLTLRLADGLALATDSAAGGSFGTRRCRLVARAIWNAFSQGEQDRPARLARLAAGWSLAGLDPLLPHLGEGCSTAMIGPAIPETTRHAPRVLGSKAPDSPLDAALRIGRLLCETAWWDRAGEDCNWVGRSPLERMADGRIEPAAAALGADLYGGSAGIALYLAQLHALTGDGACRRTAVGAMGRSIRQAERRPDRLASPLSFFEGRLGVAYASRAVGLLLGDEGLLHQAAALLPRIDPDLSDPHPLDLIGGNAGAIPALLEMSEAAGPEEAHGATALAVALGDELCAKATRVCGVWSWDPDVAYGPGVAPAPLGGMSHGASGIGLALLSLFARTGRTDFRDAARGAFAYEDSLYCPEARNWRDLRQSQAPPAEPGTARCGWAWCHGAPGITLSRVLAAELDPELTEWHLEAARIGLATTLTRMDELRKCRRHDASLCHGMAGLIDIALITGMRLGEGACMERAEGLAQGLIERHGVQCDYPSGLGSGGRSPSLMLGLAGTGYLLLRLHAPERVPSLLLAGHDTLMCLVRGPAASRLRAENSGENG
jgi:hypothetical protein